MCLVALRIPVDRSNHRKEEIKFLADLEQDGDKVLLASGGKPGLGNIHVASRKVGKVRE